MIEEEMKKMTEQDSVSRRYFVKLNDGFHYSGNIVKIERGHVFFLDKYGFDHCFLCKDVAVVSAETKLGDVQ